MNSINCLLLLLLHFQSVLSASYQQLSCRDVNGNAVEWFTSIKLPKIVDNSDWSQLKSGAALVYQDVHTPGKWQRAPYLITDSQSHIAMTIAPIYSKSPELTYLLYNDQPPPDRKNFMDKGHAKGLIIFDGVSGVWLVHSVPNFPPISSNGGSYSYPSSGHLYGQSFLCMSLSASELDTVATQLYYNNVHIYDKQISPSVLDSNPHLHLLVQRSRPPPAPYKSTLTFKAANGTEFTSFAKDGRFRQDLYDEDVAPYLKTDLSVEAWRNGNGNIPSDCNGSYSVMNVNHIHFDVPNDLDRDVKYETNNDHSKWAVGATDANPWACVGDINRQTGQFKRGGGTVCFKNVKVWKSYFDLISGIDPCDKHVESSIKPKKNKNLKGSKHLKKWNNPHVDSTTVTPNVASVDFDLERYCRYLPDGTVECKQIARKISKVLSSLARDLGF